MMDEKDKEIADLKQTIEHYKADLETIRKIYSGLYERMVEYRTKYMELKRDTRIAKEREENHESLHA
jgi:lysine/ornithine N-monooxygenase